MAMHNHVTTSWYSSPEFWALAGVFVGGILTWILNELSQFFRSRGENIRIKKRVLHDLLEINHLISPFDIQPLAEQCLKYIEKDIIKSTFNDDERKIIFDTIQNALVSIIAEETIDDLKELDENYLAAIIELSKVDPISAYYLRNKTRLFENFSKIETFVEDTKSAIAEIDPEGIIPPPSLPDPDIMKTFAEETKVLREETIQLAKSISWKTKSQVKKIIGPENFELDDEMKQMAVEIYNEIEEVARMSSEQHN